VRTKGDTLNKGVGVMRDKRDLKPHTLIQGKRLKKGERQGKKCHPRTMEPVMVKK